MSYLVQATIKIYSIVNIASFWLSASSWLSNMGVH